MTVRQYYKTKLKIASNINKEDSAVKILIIEICNFSTAEFYLNYDKEINQELLERLEIAFDLYFNKNQPIQYILGYTYFYNLKIFVNKEVLIPRGETEILVDEVIKGLKKFPNPKIIDMGCGSGAISLALKKEIPSSIITAVDISLGALEIAKKNADYHHLQIDFILSDLFLNIKGKFDCLVSNPPYIAYDEEVENIVYANEPHDALFAKNNGLYFYNEILKQSKFCLNQPSLIFFEIPYNKDIELIEIVKRYYLDKEYQIIKDFNNHSRILMIRNC